ncbi:uncharacterized protein ACOB8E_013738 [Sarcophilus harrisii]
MAAYGMHPNQFHAGNLESFKKGDNGDDKLRRAGREQVTQDTSSAIPDPSLRSCPAAQALAFRSLAKWRSSYKGQANLPRGTDLLGLGNGRHVADQGQELQDGPGVGDPAKLVESATAWKGGRWERRSFLWCGPSGMNCGRYQCFPWPVALAGQHNLQWHPRMRWLSCIQTVGADRCPLLPKVRAKVGREKPREAQSWGLGEILGERGRTEGAAGIQKWREAVEGMKDSPSQFSFTCPLLREHRLEDYEVKLGAHQLSTYNPDSVVMTVAKGFTHHNYAEKGSQGDIHPVWLPAANASFPNGLHCTVTGWGNSHSSSNTLQIYGLPEPVIFKEMERLEDLICTLICFCYSESF